MRKIIFFFIGLLLTIDTFANVNFIDITKISNDSKYAAAFKLIKDNQQYYNHWTNEWSYDKSKVELIKMLRDNYATFSTIETKSTELFLLLGDISQYLYNLDDSVSYELAVSNYTAAVKNSPKDYRAYWFLGYHYALSTVTLKAIDNLLKAQVLLPTDQPSDFWNDYAFATASANMPSHCIFAMDKIRSITGTAGSFETQLGPTIHKRIIDLDKDKPYEKQDIWATAKEEKGAFTSRPLGMKIRIDPKWNLSIYDYNNRKCAFIITPSTLKNKKGKDIHYTVALIMKVADDEEKLDDYLTNLVFKYPNKKQIAFSDKYDNMIAYEIKDNTTYQDIGGGHMYMVGIERSAPKYPGLLLENPFELPQGKKDDVTHYRASDSNNRFKGKIFYAIMLDSCEDIHDQTLAIFKNLFDNQITIE